jgi:hypothetical protein
MDQILSSLFDYKVKRQGLILATVFFILDKLLYIKPEMHSNAYFLHIFFNYLVALGLLTAVNSKDKEDDERSMKIRYGILKFSIGFFVIVFGITALLSGYIDIKALSMLTILYCVEGLLALHLVLLLLANKYNPSWLFKEKTAPQNLNQLMVGFFYAFYFIAAMMIALSIFIKS